MYLGRALRTNETLPDFRKRCRVTRHSRIFRGLMGSQRTPGFWGVTRLDWRCGLDRPLARIEDMASSASIHIG